MNDKLNESFSDFMYESNYSKVADKIKDVYLNNIDELPLLKKQHFLSRLSKVYGNHWDSDISIICKALTKEIEDLFDEYSKGSYDKSISNFIDFRTGNNADTDSKRRGNDWVLKNKKETERFLAYLEVLMKTNIVHRLKCEGLFNSRKLEEIKSWLISNWEKNVDYIIENPESFKMIPVQSINIFYYMESLNWLNPDIVDKKEKLFLKTFRNEYGSDLKSSVDFNNYLYALTHILIGKSWFYEYKLPDYREKYGWILDFLFSNEKRIQEECTPDIVIEIGVVLLICNEMKKIDSYKKYTLSKINDEGIIPPLNSEKSKSSMQTAEHSNILAIMLLKGF